MENWKDKIEGQKVPELELEPMSDVEQKEAQEAPVEQVAVAEEVLKKSQERIQEDAQRVEALRAEIAEMAPKALDAQIESVPIPEVPSLETAEITPKYSFFEKAREFITGVGPEERDRRRESREHTKDWVLSLKGRDSRAKIKAEKWPHSNEAKMRWSLSFFEKAREYVTGVGPIERGTLIRHAREMAESDRSQDSGSLKRAIVESEEYAKWRVKEKEWKEKVRREKGTG